MIDLPPAQPNVWCMPELAMQHALATTFRERRRQAVEADDEIVLRYELWMNERQGTWTLLKITVAGNACVHAHGLLADRR